ncbi:hypothetical protein G4B88_027796 [Cannabis sativa]|uniref:Reverse transcriptase zinc-binding domain-containing protein n=1 Tax=Cannabis sativa TaxID=3483 RepID=A0A7J6DL90_CANSA|nr:hypothetical protein G4B88_018413 [Cannabis sativa]KAF4347383.1 hypothetical protein G4B88_027796 [Cannabis sativa]
MLIWKDSTSGSYSVKGAYWVDQKARFGVCKPLWKWIWDPKIHPRVSMMIWRSCLKIIPTGDKFSPSNTCPVCLSVPESPIHLFARCAFASVIWFSGPLSVRIESIPGNCISSLITNLCSNLDRFLRTRMLVYAGVIMESIWKHRNLITHSTGPLQSIESVRLEH